MDFDVMDFSTYANKARKYCQPSCWNVNYLSLGFISEVGEVAGLIKRIIRGDRKVDEEFKIELIRELGDVAWYTAMLCKSNEEDSDAADFEFISKCDGSQMPESIESIYASLYSLLDSGSDIYSKYNVNLYEDLIELIEVCLVHFDIDASVSDVFVINIAKLEDRQERGVISGSGGER